jgi:Uma2 family endonuclease
VLLLVEIADSSLRYDREIKGPLYARHGIPEFWLINITAGLIEIHQEPDSPKSLYRNVTTASEGLFAPASFPEVTLDVRELLS